MLVMIGVRSDGTKELLAVEDGYRESAESWSTVLRDLKRQGMQAPVLDKLPKRLQAKAKRALQEILSAETRQQAEEGIERFAAAYEAKYPKAVASLRRDQDLLLTFYDFPAEHWQHIRSTNAIESPFATVRLRQRVTKGAGSRTKALLMAFKLFDMAQQRWRRVNAPHLVPLVRAGVRFDDGVQQVREKKEKDAA